MSGTPVIASDKGAIPEILDPAGGFVCETEADYLKAVTNLDRIAPRTCREMALDRFHYLTMARAYLDEYRRELAPERREGSSLLRFSDLETIAVANVSAASLSRTCQEIRQLSIINPILRELGFQSDDRVVVVHADDVGLCHSTLPAVEELMKFGLVTSASAMVPCPWFLEVVAWHQENPHFDLGIHLTLTSEWDRYRWGPISTRAESTGLLDDQGFFHRTTSALRRLARREAVGAEMRSQVDLAERLGLAPTHIDNHMFAAMCNEFVDDYSHIASERRIPAFMSRTSGTPSCDQEWFRQRAEEWENRAQPVFDAWRVVTRRGHAGNHETFVQNVFEQLPAGLSCILLHPVVDTPEIRHITGEWRNRVADYETFRRPSLRTHIRNLGIHLITYKPIRDAMRRQIARCSP